MNTSAEAVMPSSSSSSSSSSLFSSPSIPAIFRPTPIMPLMFPPIKLELPVFEESSLASSTSSSSRCSSTESSAAPGKIRRGRPQQEILDGSDAHSQKKRQRRLYARQYRAQMRQKVENVKSLHDEKEQLEREVNALRAAVSSLQNEIAQKDLLISLMHINRIQLS